MMQFPSPLIRGRLIKRYKRFLSDIELESGEIVIAHIANPGSMMGLKDPGTVVWLSPSDNPKRKLKYSWELVQFGEDFVGVNTAHPNSIVAEAILAGEVPELDGYDNLKREVKYGENSRIDIFLEKDGRPDCYVEVKSVTLAREVPNAEFPDSVTARGAKHLAELINMVDAGKRAVMFFLIQRTDCTGFSIAADIDPVYREGFTRAAAAGVEILCYDCHINTSEIRIGIPRPINP